ncbi:hypothetical protein NQ317_016708 [Molorchus minor]|uniref:PAP-associated domain-containing protein n=1 Tax=Molorchus minor TaxID=1323400 RepID=A0ABQ9J5Z3_9CUCU|nr:hypothetical protein NQ317_016708 [Molorchus minor]
MSVKKLRELNPDTSLVINGWETINYTMTIDQMKTYVEPCPLTVTELIKGFFEYYFKFPYDTDVVCPLLGHTVQKSLFHSYPIAEILQKEMKSYITQLDSRDPETFRALSPICIQDPFDLSHNLTKACQASTVNKFKTLCEISLKLLESL